MNRLEILSPKIDFVFKRIFGNEKHLKILISFLNSVMTHSNPIESVEIKEAKEELFRISSNEKERMLYEDRKASLLDKISALENAEQKGLQKGLQQGERNKAIENAKNFLNLGISVEIVAQGTGLSLEEVNRIKNNLN